MNTKHLLRSLVAPLFLLGLLSLLIFPAFGLYLAWGQGFWKCFTSVILGMLLAAAAACLWMLLFDHLLNKIDKASSAPTSPNKEMEGEPSLPASSYPLPSKLSPPQPMFQLSSPSGSIDDKAFAPAARGSRKIWYGGFDEPYCSKDCYNEAGAKISGGFLQGVSGPCGFCQRDVFAGSGVKLIPYRRAFLFICPACPTQAKDFVRAIRECCMCENSLTVSATETQGAVVDTEGSDNQQFTACPSCGALSRAGIAYASSKYGEDMMLGIYRCSYGTVYCDKCSGGGLITLPFCPDIHEERKKIGFVAT